MNPKLNIATYFAMLGRNVAVNHLVATLNEFKMPERGKSEVLSVLGPLKNDIVEK